MNISDIDISKMIDEIFDNEKCVKHIANDFKNHMTRTIKSKNINIYDILAKHTEDNKRGDTNGSNKISD